MIIIALFSLLVPSVSFLTLTIFMILHVTMLVNQYYVDLALQVVNIYFQAVVSISTLNFWLLGGMHGVVQTLQEISKSIPYSDSFSNYSFLVTWM